MDEDAGFPPGCHPERRSERRLRGEGKRGTWVWFLPSEELGVAVGENPGPSLICFRAEARGLRPRWR